MKKILMYSDSPYAPTGFGQVVDNIFQAIDKNFNIDLVAINNWRNEQSYRANIISDDKDPFSIDLMKKMIIRGSYDILFIAYNPELALQFSEEIKDIRKREKIKYIHYAPIDTSFMTPYQEAYKKYPDIRVYYNQYAKNLLKDKGGLVINHGTLPEVFKPSDKQKARKELGLEGEFVFLNVNSNQWRKDLFRTILAFSLFNKQKKDTKLILHTNKHDMGGDIQMQILNTSYLTGNDLSKSVLVTDQNKWTFSQEGLNTLYNASDCFVTTTIGEGWGLTTTEAMSCGLPIIAPNISIFEELVPKENYLYNVTDWVMPYKDTNTPYPIGRTSDIEQLMNKAYHQRIENLSIGQKNRKVAEGLDWKNIQKQWYDLFIKQE